MKPKRTLLDDVEKVCNSIPCSYYLLCTLCKHYNLCKTLRHTIKSLKKYYYMWINWLCYNFNSKILLKRCYYENKFKWYFSKFIW